MRILYLKNLVILLISIGCYLLSIKEVESIPTNLLPTVTTFVGFILVAPVFANFAFTYGDHGNRYNFLGHLISFLVMTPCIVLVGILDLLFIRMIGEIWIFRTMLFLFILSIFLYDIWDALTERKDNEG